MICDYPALGLDTFYVFMTIIKDMHNVLYRGMLNVGIIYIYVKVVLPRTKRSNVLLGVEAAARRATRELLQLLVCTEVK